MMFLINNEAVCMKQYNNTGEGRKFHAQRGFEHLIWVFRRLDHGQRILSAIGHMLMRVLYANVTNWFVLQKVCQKELSFLPSFSSCICLFSCFRRVRNIAKVIISFVMSVYPFVYRPSTSTFFCLSFRLYFRPYICPPAWSNSAPTERSLITFFIYAFLPKIYQEISSFIKIRQKLRALYMKTLLHLWQYLADFLEW